jgi:nitrilase
VREERPVVRIAAVQAAPILFDIVASTEKACRLIAEAAEKGAALAVFGEAWLPGYPFFVFSSPANPLHWRAQGKFLENSITIPGPVTDKLCAVAKTAAIDVAIGVSELDAATRGTAYCTLLFIGREGRILGRHRKLKPTHAERAVWGDGDAVGLRAYERDYARISGLNCWEHAMVLPGYVLMSEGTQIHVATWPGTDVERPSTNQVFFSKMHLLSRAFAAQSAAYVIAVGGLRRSEDIPAEYAELAGIWPTTGDSCIIDPRGEIIAGPAIGESILLADVSLDLVREVKAACDVAGHYSRPDIFKLAVDRKPVRRVSEMRPSTDSGEAAS